MSQFNPEDERQTRRVGFGVILVSISMLLVGGAVVLYGGGFNVPSWLWLLPFIGAFALGAVAIALWLPSCASYSGRCHGNRLAA